MALVTEVKSKSATTKLLSQPMDITVSCKDGPIVSSYVTYDVRLHSVNGGITRACTRGEMKRMIAILHRALNAGAELANDKT